MKFTPHVDWTAFFASFTVQINNFFFSPKTEIGQFQKIVGGLIELVDELAKEAENEKMKVWSCILNE